MRGLCSVSSGDRMQTSTSTGSRQRFYKNGTIHCPKRQDKYSYSTVPCPCRCIPPVLMIKKKNYRLKHSRQEVTPVYRTSTKWQQFLKDFGRSEGILFFLCVIIIIIPMAVHPWSRSHTTPPLHKGAFIKNIIFDCSVCKVVDSY